MTDGLYVVCNLNGERKTVLAVGTTPNKRESVIVDSCGHIHIINNKDIIQIGKE